MKCFSLLLFLLFCILILPLSAQNLHQLSGRVSDKETQEPLIGVAVYVRESGKGIVTNSEGAFSLEMKEGNYELTFSYIGYTKDSRTISLRENQQLEISLSPAAIQTEEVVVSEKREDQHLQQMTDRISITEEEIERLPYLLGEVDPIKMLQLLPGVQSNGEGNNGIFVRGGAIDQNLILFDQAPVYNTGHLFGFFSLFNHAAIKEVNLLKGGIPASYGGRLSSILEIKTRPGNEQEWKGEGSVGVVAGNFTIEGPIAKGKSSLILSGRRTYLDLLSKVLTNDPTIFGTGIDYYFNDLNARLDVELSAKDQLAFSAFNGTDDFLFDGKNSLYNKIKWTNHTASVSWEHFYQPKNFHRTSVFASRYEMDFVAGIHEYDFAIHSSIDDYGIKWEWLIGSLQDHQLSFGFEYLHHALVPNNMRASGTDIEFTFVEQEKLPNQEEAIFIQDEWTIHPKWTIAAGMRLSAYQQLGPFTRYVTDHSLKLQDTVFYKRNEVVANWWNLDPRISLTFRSGENSSFKASFDKMHQYLHMAPVSSVSLPTDVWVPSSGKLKPQQGLQYALGYFRNFNDNTIESSVSAYYKIMGRHLEYRDGVIVGYSKGYNYDDNFIVGKGQSFGLEFFAKKSKGPLTGWFSYTLSKTNRKFEEVNGGQKFPAKYDRLHSLSLVGAFQLNDHWSFSGVWVYSSGNAMTLPVGRYIIGGNIINEYGDRNSFRMPAYHRMDLSATYHAVKRKGFESSWVFSVYNVYNRKNPYYIYFNTEGNVKEYYMKVNLEQVSLFPVIPSVAYQFKF